MRKRLKKKKRSCSLCKPHKMGWELRYKAKELDKIERAEKEVIERKNTNDNTID